MALIKCPGCGNMVSDLASNCPKCGCQVSNAVYQNTNYDETRIIHQDNGARVPYNVPREPKSNSNIWLYAIIALLSLALVGAGAYIFLNKDDKGGSTPNTEVKNDDSGASVVTFKDEPQSHAPQAPAQHERQSSSASPAKSNKVANGTYYLSGAITHKQNYYIEMEVKVRGDQATGRYIVTNGENIYVTLTGTIDADGNMKLTEYKNGQPTGYYFTGRFDESLYTGTYRCTTRKLVMDFSASTY